MGVKDRYGSKAGIAYTRQISPAFGRRAEAYAVHPFTQQMIGLMAQRRHARKA